MSPLKQNGSAGERSHLCQSHREEVANAITHALGVPASVVALVVLVVKAFRMGTAWHVVGASIFGASLVLLYLSSALYHSFTTPKTKRVFQILDHTFIFVLIAGTYTPFLLVNLRGPWGWSLLGVVWGLAVVGIILKAFLLPRFQKQGSFIYLAMGWLISVAILEVIATVPMTGLIWLIVGGLFYTAGVVFFLLERVPFFHTVWHLFVLGGSISHFFAVWYGVLPVT